MTTDQFKLIQEATDRGFLTATTIIPAHYFGTTCKPRLIIPRGSTLYFNGTGDLVYLYNSSAFFPSETHSYSFWGIIYDSKENKWAEILEHEEKKLTPFNLVKGRSYFIEGDNVKWYVSNNSENGSIAKAGFCINTNSGYNSDRCYAERDAQFYHSTKNGHSYDNIKEVKIRELTDDEGRWFSHCKDRNKFVPYDLVITKSPIIPLTEFPKSGMCWFPTKELLNYLKNRDSSRSSGQSITLQNIIDYSLGLVWNEHNIWTVSTSSSYKEYSIEELMRHIPSSISEHRKQYPLTRNECLFPEKWSIRIDKDNRVLLQDFLIKHSIEYKGYSTSWKPTQASGNLFVYPQQKSGTYILWDKNDISYREITTEQFKKHVLTHTDKQQQINESSKTKKDDKESSTTSANSCKIQRLNFTIRDTAPIRGIGLKCPKIQVKIGSGHLPD